MSDLIQANSIPAVQQDAGWQPDPEHPRRRPPWIKVRAPSGETYEMVRDLMRSKPLHTVCEEAHVPEHRRMLGPRHGHLPDDGRYLHPLVRVLRHQDRTTQRRWTGRSRTASPKSVQGLNLRHVVITSVNRDERPDGGAPIFAMVIRRIRQLQPGCSIEVLIPDFKGSEPALKIVMDAQPEILNHNVETVPRLFRKVQPQDHYEWAMATLRNAKRWIRWC